MKKTIFLIFLIYSAVFAQSDNSMFSIPLANVLDSESQLDLSEMYVAIDAGIDKIQEGKCSIEMSNPPELYYVVLTPLTPSGNLYYSQAEEGGFIVTEENSEYSKENIVEFQYIVFTPLSEARKIASKEKSQMPLPETEDEDDDFEEPIGITTTLPVIQPAFPNSDQPVKSTN
ncbi:MAG: hypothetical protein ACLFSQ_05890 [Candidatus Zixiibacteriota bacterium]